MLNEVITTKQSYWVAASYSTSESKWLWLDKTPVRVNNWKYSQPRKDDKRNCGAVTHYGGE
jgi:hypothetical protein